MGVNVAPNLKPRTTRQPQDTIDGHTRLVTIDWRLCGPGHLDTFLLLAQVHSCTSERLIHSDTARVLGRMVWITCLIHARPSRTRRL